MLLGRGRLVREDEDMLSMRDLGKGPGIVPARQDHEERVVLHVAEAQVDSQALRKVDVPISPLDRSHDVRPERIPAGDARAVEVSFGLKVADDLGAVTDAQGAVDEAAVRERLM